MTRLLAGAACVGLIACAPSRGQGRQVSPEADAELTLARDTTLTAAAVVLAEVAAPKRDGIVVSAEWSFQYKGEWRTYVDAVTPGLQAKGYGAAATEADLIAFSKRVPGDVYHVTIRRTWGQPALRLAATFSATPD
jgi:hypothetical protein